MVIHRQTNISLWTGQLYYLGIPLCIYNIRINYALGLLEFSLLQLITFIFVRSARQFVYLYKFSSNCCLLASPYMFFFSHRQIIRCLYRLERAVFKIFLAYCFPALWINIDWTSSLHCADVCLFYNLHTINSTLSSL